jgi:hypothetical protein
MANPVMIKAVIAQFRLALWHIYVRSMAITKYNCPRQSMPFNYFNKVLMSLIFDKIHDW